jgi:hypothetical protein
MSGGERSKNISPLKGRSKRFVGNVRVYFSKRLPAPPAKFYFQMSPSLGWSLSLLAAVAIDFASDGPGYLEIATLTAYP